MSHIAGYIVYEDNTSYYIRRYLTQKDEIILAKDQVVTVSKKRLTLAEKKKEEKKVADKKPKPVRKTRLFNIDWGIGATFGMFPYEDFYRSGYDSSWSEYNFLAFSVADLRLSVFFDFRFNITPIFSAGVELGVGYMVNMLKVFTDSRGDVMDKWDQLGYEIKNIFLLDFPFRGFIRVGNDFIYGQFFGGYYLSVFPMATINGNPVDDSGGEIGARLVIKDLFLEFSYVFSYYDHIRIGIGYEGKIF